ncbi:unnamed protein product [Medioppia subpectinata]|uniref:Uncharacterized protein n=1 Tax=Medioppia subpectinata TaxID=1979941 RepID=A0A7R9LLC7_9ACAR|nr:unnamed protein product [Medioppia subpectinata]CAG2119275.1 unnamed protein product [Medioppia subpectinata]
MDAKQWSQRLALMAIVSTMASVSGQSAGPTPLLSSVDESEWQDFTHEFTCPDNMCSAEALDEDMPPDAILSMPPPPLPPAMHALLVSNRTAIADDCNLCHIFKDPSDYDFSTVTTPDLKDADSWLSVIVVTILGSTLFCILFLIVLFRCKNWKIFPVSDSCPILPESFLGGHKSAPPPCSPTDSCISPVVNEKSPQSVITDAPTKKTCISSKYWKRGPNGDPNSPDGYGGGPCDRMGGTDVSADFDPYSDAASCTSSPVYAELDPAGVTHALSTGPTQIILNGPAINPYAVCNTYSEVADAVRMAALGSSSAALLPDASYDNAAYLDPNHPQHHIYQSRSLRRAAHRAATLGQLGSATPLLRSHYALSNASPQQLNYLTGGRPQKKPRPSHSSGSRTTRALHDEMQSTRFERQHGLYTDLPVHSPTLSTFRTARHMVREPKRPLPPVPGVRL